MNDSERSKFNAHAQMCPIYTWVLSAIGGKFSIDCYGVRQRKKTIRVLEEGTRLAAAPSSETGSLVLFSTIWAITDSRFRGETLSQPSRHSFLPGPEAVLSLIYCQALTDTFSDLLRYLILTLVLMWIFKIACKR